jgi:hypothetical protein
MSSLKYLPETQWAHDSKKPFQTVLLQNFIIIPE